MSGPTGTRDDDRSAAPFRTRGSEPTLQAALDRLAGGCGLLVTGDVSTEAYRVAAARYFGESSNDRRRVLGLTHDSLRADDWLPGGVDSDSDDADVVRLGDAVRDPAAVDPADPTDSADPSVEDGGRTATDAETFSDRFLDAIRADDGEPTDSMYLRVGLFRVDGLRAALGEERAGDLLCDAAAATRDRGGMAHFHLPRPAAETTAPRADPIVDSVATRLGEHLDVIVQLRFAERAAVPEERWHILGWGTTDWHPLR